MDDVPKMIRQLPEQSDPETAWDMLHKFSGGLAFDVGANVGQAARVLAPNFTKVISFEPCIESYLILQDSVPANVEVWPVAISSKHGHIKLIEAEHSIATGQLTSSYSEEPGGWGAKVGERIVPSRTLDELCEEKGLPDFVKIDVEGAEVEVMLGASVVIMDLVTTWWIEIHNEELGATIQRMLTEYTQTVVRHDHYKPGDAMYNNHYFLMAVPK
jgi:FkbM family methyltransferase